MEGMIDAAEPTDHNVRKLDVSASAQLTLSRYMMRITVPRYNAAPAKEQRGAAAEPRAALTYTSFIDR